MEQSPSWKTNNHSASQEIPRISWKVKVRYRVHKSLPMSRMQAVHTCHAIRSNIKAQRISADRMFKTF
jgi:hypothetical protein